ncbi:hypothetical protein PoB_005048900, partial [Plakobranchus ocellatus]
ATKQGNEISKESTHLVTEDTCASESSVRNRVLRAPNIFFTDAGYYIGDIKDLRPSPKMSQAGPVTAYPRNENIKIKDPSAGKDIPKKLTNIVYPDHTTIEEVTDSLQSGVLPPQVVWSTLDGYSTGGACAPWHGPRMLPVDLTTAGTREKNIIEIKDPLTDRDVAEEVINSAYADHKHAEQDPSVRFYDIQ